MNNLWLVLILTTFMMIVTLGFTLAKRYIMKGFGTITITQVLSLKFWITFFLNPYIIVILFFNLGIFGLNMWIFSMAGVNTVTVLSNFLGVPIFLLTIFVTKVLLGEEILPTQYKAIVLLVISMVLATIGTYWYFTNSVQM